MSIQALAFMLLIGHILSLIFIILVIKKQWRLLKLPVAGGDSETVRHFRRMFFFLSLAIVAGNVIPVIIDTLTLFVETGRPAQLKPISVAYAFSNMTTAVVSAFLIWMMYRIASRSNLETIKEHGRLEDVNKSLTKDNKKLKKEVKDEKANNK